MKNMQMRNHPAWLSALVSAALLLAGITSALAQNEVRSTDLTQALRTFVDNMNAARSAEQAAHSKATELLKAAETPAAQLNDTNLPPQTRFEAHAKVIELQKGAIQTRLDAARQGAKLLSAAKDALHEISADLGGNVAEDLKDLPAPEDQPKVDARISDLNFPADATIEPETADALTAARSYYDMACKGTAKGPGGSATFQTVARRLKAWEAKNRRSIVLCDAALKRLELAAVSGLTSIGNYTLDQALGSPGNFDQASLGLGVVPLAPEISANGEAASPTPAKVSLRRALKQ
jgi:outer membrane murein-binding lipoprotein Lpp